MLQEKSLSAAQPGAGTTIDFTGKWKNEFGSVATITTNGEVITGEYDSAVSDNGTSTAGKLSGYINGDLVAFVVHWDEFQALTSWVGQIVPGSNPQQLKTLWQMTRQVAEGEEWASINAGSDSFTKQA